MDLLPHYLVASFIGGLVGAVEIFQRYRAEPLEAVKTRWGLAYLLLNGALGALAFYVAVLYNELTADGVKSLTLIQWSAVSGFGAAAVLRSKLLNIQLSDGKEVALGPEIVVQTFLGVIDRELDRSRAKSRFESVRKLMAGIDFEKSKNRLPMQVFQAMQGVTEEESKTLMERVAEVSKLKSVSSQDKSYLLGFYLLDLAGERFLTDILGKGSKYRQDFEAGEKTPEDAAAAAGTEAKAPAKPKYEFVPPAKKGSAAAEPSGESKQARSP